MMMVLPSSRLRPLEQAQDLLGRRAVEVAGRLVGDDERRIGDRARARSRRAAAGRPTARSDSAPSRSDEPDQRQRVLDVLAPLAPRQAREQQRQLDVLERREHRHQVVELEDEADVRARASAASSPSDSRAMSTPATCDLARDGLSMPAIRLSSVDLPEPDGPISATKSPARHVEVDVDQHRDHLVAAHVVLGQAADLDQRLGLRALGRRGFGDGARHRGVHRRGRYLAATFTSASLASVSGGFAHDLLAALDGARDRRQVADLRARRDRHGDRLAVAHDEHDGAAVALRQRVGVDGHQRASAARA